MSLEKPTASGMQNIEKTLNSRRTDIDFVRGVAILMAVGFHFNNAETGILIIDYLQLPARYLGWAGVDLFFVLSGFLVGGLIFQEFIITGAFDSKRFFVRRIFKIWPVLYLYIALLIVSGRYSPHQILPQTLFHVQNFFVTPLAHLWSLAVEEHFYLLFGLTFPIFTRQIHSTQHLIVAVLVGIMILALIFRLIGVAAGLESVTLQIQTQFRLDSLACGVLIAYVKTFHPDAFHKLTGMKIRWLIALTIGVVFLAIFRDEKYVIAGVGYTVAYCTGAAFLMFTQNPLMNFSKNIIIRVIAWVGVYSYAMYVFQFAGFRIGEFVWEKTTSSEMSATTRLLLHYAGALIVAVVVTKLIERPMLSLRDRFFPGSSSSIRRLPLVQTPIQ